MNIKVKNWFSANKFFYYDNTQPLATNNNVISSRNVTF